MSHYRNLSIFTAGPDPLDTWEQTMNDHLHDEDAGFGEYQPTDPDATVNTRSLVEEATRLRPRWEVALYVMLLTAWPTAALALALSIYALVR